MVAILVAVSILVILSVDYLFFRKRSPVAIEAIEPPAGEAAPFVAVGRSPLGVYFSPDHSWVFLEPSGTAKLGIDDFARSIVGAIDSFDRRCTGETIRKGDIILRARHEDRSLDFRSPVDGIIESVNHDVVDGREPAFGEPITSSWIYEIQPRDTSEIPKTMMIGQTAKNWLNHEVQRLKVFLATIAPQNKMVGQTLQDGGLPQWGLIDSLADDDWRKLGEKFFG